MLTLSLALSVLALAAPGQEIETQRLTGIQDVFQDFYGNTVTTDGPWLFVGAYNEDSGANTFYHSVGTIHVYYRTVSGWVHTQIIQPSSYTAVSFGDKMDVDGGVLVVGNQLDRWQGKAFVYELSSGHWDLAQELTTSDPSIGESYGNAVAVDGARIIVAEAIDSSLNYPWGSNGRVWIYEKGQSGWIETAVLYPEERPGLEALAFGLHVALSGNTLAVSAHGNTYHVQMFEYLNGTWQHTAWINRQGINSASGFGDGLALDGDWLAVGEPAQWNVFPARFGKVSIYKSSSTTAGEWDLQQVLQASNASTPAQYNTDHFGFALDMEGPRLAVGALWGESGNGNVQGQSYLFERDQAGQWTETRRFSSLSAERDNVPNSALGHDVAVSEYIVAAGARIDLGTSQTVQSGAAYVYEQGLGLPSCPGVIHSGGTPAELEITGVALASVNGLTARASQLPAPGFGLIVGSLSSGSPTTPLGSQGDLCLGGTLVRLRHTLSQATLNGEWDAPLDLPQAGITVQPGSTWHFQLWYRDLNPGPVSNFSNMVSVTWQ